MGTLIFDKSTAFSTGTRTNVFDQHFFAEKIRGHEKQLNLNQKSSIGTWNFQFFYFLKEIDKN